MKFVTFRDNGRVSPGVLCGGDHIVDLGNA